jgi:hypothetical protein
MKARLILDRVAVVALLAVVLGALLFLGGSVDPCLASSPACGVHEGVSPWLILVPVILWVLALIDIVRA